MNGATPYIAAAYGVVFFGVLVWLLIHSLRFARLERELTELLERTRG